MAHVNIVRGFYQVRMRTADIPKTGFTTPFGNFELTVVPMGLYGAPSTFQMLMDEALTPDIVCMAQNYLSGTS